MTILFQPPCRRESGHAAANYHYWYLFRSCGRRERLAVPQHVSKLEGVIDEAAVNLAGASLGSESDQRGAGSSNELAAGEFHRAIITFTTQCAMSRHSFS